MIVVELKIWRSETGLPPKLLTRHTFNGLCEMMIRLLPGSEITAHPGERIIGFTFKPEIDSFLITNRARDPGYEEGAL